MFYIAPPILVSENPELNFEKTDLWKSYKEKIIQELGLIKNNNSSEPHKLNGFLKKFDTFEYPGDTSADLVLDSFFLFPSGAVQKKPFLAAGFYNLAGSCFSVGTFLYQDKNFEPIAEMPSELQKDINFFKPIKVAKESSLNPVFLDFQIQEAMGKRMQVVTEAIYLKKLLADVKKNEFVGFRSSLTNFGCSAELFKKETLEVRKAHRVLSWKAKLENFKSEKLKNMSWPKMIFKSDSVLSETYIPIQPLVVSSGSVVGAKNVLFNPENLASIDVPKVLQKLHDLPPENAKIVERKGRFVLLNRGRAFGFDVGTRLIGPKKQKLHVVKLEPRLNNPDACWALIRWEDKVEVLKNGDILELDKEVYPKGN